MCAGAHKRVCIIRDNGSIGGNQRSRNSSTGKRVRDTGSTKPEGMVLSLKLHVEVPSSHQMSLLPKMSHFSGGNKGKLFPEASRGGVEAVAGSRCSSQKDLCDSAVQEHDAQPRVHRAGSKP